MSFNQTEQGSDALPLETQVAQSRAVTISGLTPMDPPPTQNIRIQLPSLKSVSTEVIKDVNKVIQAMGAATALFPAPVPDLETVDKANQELLDSLVTKDFESRATRKVTAMKQNAVLILFTQLSAYVLGVAKGDAGIVDISGFTRVMPRKKPAANPTPGTPEVVSSGPGKANGTAMLQVKGFNQAKIFIVERKDEDGVWYNVDAFNTLKLNLEGLPSGMNTLRVWAKRGNKRSPQPSTEVTIRVL